MTDLTSAPIKNWTRWIIVVAVMLAAIIEVLDMTIVNVGLTHMMGAFGTTRNEITWVVTSYIVSAAIVMPLTGFLVEIIGRRRLLLISILGFMIASVMCGLSQDIFQIVFSRVAQGVFGASLIPLSQYVLMDTFPKQERSKAMAIWGTGIMSGPILGPLVGGYIIDALNWHWIFFINVPICIVALLLVAEVISETPIKKRALDWIGVAWYVIGISCLQIFLDRGEIEDWFESKFIIMLLIVAIAALGLFVMRGLKKGHSIINFRIFLDYNFTISCILIVVFSMGLFGLLILQPIMLQDLMGYPAKLTGLLMAPREITTALGMMLVAIYIKVIDARLFVSAGLLISALSSYLMSQLDLSASFGVMSFLVLVQGLGTGLFFVPLATIGFTSLSKEFHAEGSGLFNFWRNLGTSIGISLINTYVSQQSQVHWQRLGGFLNPYNVALQNSLNHFHWSLQDPQAKAYYIQQLLKQSSMLAFLNAYWLITLGFLICMPLILLVKKPTKQGLMFLE